MIRKRKYAAAVSAAFAAGQAVGRKESGVELAALKLKFNREVDAHRANVKLLHDSWADRDAMASGFMDLHDLAKRFAAPKLSKLDKPFAMPTVDEDLPARAKFAAGD